MTIRTKANFSGIYLTSSGIWPDNTTGQISPSDLRTGILDTWDSWTNEDSLLSGIIANLSGTVQININNISANSGNITLNSEEIDIIQTGSGIPTGYFQAAYFGDISSGNYSQFEDTGFLTSFGSGLAWEDLRFPAVGLNPPGSIRDADRDNSDSVYAGTLLYDADVEEMTAGQAQMPHSWKEGSTIHPHIHWGPTDTSSGNVIWQLDYDIADVNGNFTGSYSTITVTGVVENDPTKHQLLEFGPIDMSGYTLSTIMLWRVSRIGDSGDDTYSEEARLYEFDIHYQVDSRGSRKEYTK